MLNALSVRNVVLIARLDLELAPGFTAITGETGAGKSILLDALALAMGARAERVGVRAGADSASATAAFTLPLGHPAHRLLDEAGLGLGAGDDLVLRRAVTTAGRTRAFVNDEPAGVALVTQIARTMVEVHGQHDGRGLMDPRTHRPTLDAFAGAEREREICAAAWMRLAEAQAVAEERRAAAAKAAEDRAELEEARAELDALEPQAGEDAALVAERRFLQNAERTLADLSEAERALAGDEGMEARLGAALRAVERAAEGLGGDGGEASHAGPNVAVMKAVDALDRALIEAQEAAGSVREAVEAVVVEPGRLEVVEERLFALRAAARKHGVEVEALPALRDRVIDALALLDGEGDTLAGAQAEVAEALGAYRQAADALTAKRRAAAERLDAAVAQELAPLKLDRAQFRTRIDAPDSDSDDRRGPDGGDVVAFEVATNPGAPFGPLERIASGGELSRFALALKVALAQTGGAHVFIFDEVDQGVGGAVADAIGKRLARLAAQSQVLVVTHSPQVAACADHHLKIEKIEEDGGMRTLVRSLSGQARREEIARMLAGEAVTDAAREAASALMGAEA